MYKIFLFLFFSAFLNAELINGVSVVVKGEAITLYDIKEEMRTLNVDAAAATDILIRKKLEEAEINERKISVSSSEVYDDIKKIAAMNKMSIDEFYDAVRNSNGLTSTQLKEKTKERLLSQKLYSSIAYSSLDAPGEDEIKEYYELHKEQFAHPSAFDVVVYSTQNRDALQQKITIPLYHSDEIRKDEQTLPYDRLPPELLKMLQNTKEKSFSPIFQDVNGLYTTFYLKEIQGSAETNYDSTKEQIINLIMSQKREQVLSDYFARLRNNADIQIIREAKE